MPKIQVNTRPQNRHDYVNGVNIEQLERKITILTSSCNSVFARQIDFENLAEAKLMRANYFKFQLSRAQKIAEAVKLEMVL